MEELRVSASYMARKDRVHQLRFAGSKSARLAICRSGRPRNTDTRRALRAFLARSCSAQSSLIRSPSLFAGHLHLAGWMDFERGTNGNGACLGLEEVVVMKIESTGVAPEVPMGANAVGHRGAWTDKACGSYSATGLARVVEIPWWEAFVAGTPDWLSTDGCGSARSYLGHWRHRYRDRRVGAVAGIGLEKTRPTEGWPVLSQSS